MRSLPGAPRTVGEDRQHAHTDAYRSYLLTVLVLILAFNLAERVALGLLLQDIKREFTLSDTQLGFLTGIAFALFYAVVGIPIARWADRGNRVTIIAVTTALWGAAVAVCGAAGSFLQLLLIRIGVAVGESGSIPPASSLLSDYFSRAHRPRALALYNLGYPLSAVIGYVLAGWLNQLYGWRITFVMLGVPGLVLALLARFTLREPRQAVASRPVVSPALPSPPNLQEVFALIWANTTFRHLLIGFSFSAFFSYGIALWKPAFFIRTYGLDTAQVGTWFAAVHAVSGLVGMYWGGELATRRAAHREHVQLKAVTVAYCGFAAVSAAIYLSPNHYLAFALLAVSTTGLYMVYGPLFAMFQSLMPAHLRAVSLAIVYLFVNLIGMGLGPLAAGVLSDAFSGSVGSESLRYSLLVLCPGYFLAAWHMWRASRTVLGDIEATHHSEVEAQRSRAAAPLRTQELGSIATSHQ